MSDKELVKTFGRRGWTIRLYTQPDHDSRPGEDDVTPALTYWDKPDLDPGELGLFPGVVQGEYYYVTAEEVERLAKAWGDDFDATALESIEAAAREFADGIRHYVGVIATAERAGVVMGEDSLWGIEVTESEPERSMSYGYLAEAGSECADVAIEMAEMKLKALCR